MAMVQAAHNRRQLRYRGRVQGERVVNGSSSVLTSIQVSGSKGHLFGDGLAIWLTKDRAQPGPVFGNVGKARVPLRFTRLTASFRQIQGSRIIPGHVCFSSHVQFPLLTRQKLRKLSSCLRFPSRGSDDGRWSDRI